MYSRLTLCTFPFSYSFLHTQTCARRTVVHKVINSQHLNTMSSSFNPSLDQFKTYDYESYTLASPGTKTIQRHLRPLIVNSREIFKRYKP